ncbi:hypothetical protein CIK06_18575 [Plantactinospora sp. KBS50]|nr:hypothetical protein CIK06_18575 [Plantactinospora sp. KBS50]
MGHLGITPHHLAHRQKPVAFVDLVHGGRTYQNLFHLLRGWISEERAAWSVIRTKLRFIGITARTKTSPNTWRWYQAAPWAAYLPRNALVSVSLGQRVWGYLADHQHKITRSFPVNRWLDQDTRLPARDPTALAALAEAVSLVAHGRSPEGRTALTAAITDEPTMHQPWLRFLVTELRRPTTSRQG